MIFIVADACGCLFYITYIHYICNIMYVSSAPLLLSLETVSSSVVCFMPIVRYTSVLIASATGEETTVFNSGRSCCLTLKQERIYIIGRFTAGLLHDQLISNEALVVFGPTDAAKGTMGHCARLFDIHFNSFAIHPSKYSQMAPEPQKSQKFSL